MTRFTARIFLYRSRVSPKEAFEGLELGAKVSRPVLRGPGLSNGAWLLGIASLRHFLGWMVSAFRSFARIRTAFEMNNIQRGDVTL